MKNVQGAAAAAGSGAVARPTVATIREGVAIGAAEGPATFADVLAKRGDGLPVAAPARPPVVPGQGGSARATGTSSRTAGGARADRDEEDTHRRLPRSRAADDPLDPNTRHTAQMLPALPAATPPEPVVDAAQVTSARGSLEALLPMVVKRVAWTPGDGQRRAMRLEISDGQLAGGTLLVQAEGGRVHVHLDAPPHVDAHGWRARIQERLARRGIVVDAIEID